jgi:hypothetical protein
MAVLRQRYPDYEDKVGATLFSFDRRVLDYRVRRIYADSDGFYASRPPQPRVLNIGSDVPIAGFDVVPADAAGEDAAWLIDRAVELIIVPDERHAARWRTVAAAAKIPVSIGLPAPEWNSLSAFGSVAGL